MESKDFTINFNVEQNPETVFNAINNVRDWWSGEFEGTADTLGAEFTYRYGDIHRSTQKVTVFIPAKKVVWHVIDAYMSFIENKGEWKDTDIIFEIHQNSGKTEVVFTHKGLVPTYACYDNCSNAWTTLITENLKNLIMTGKS